MEDGRFESVPSEESLAQIIDILTCKCDVKYSIESEGDGYAIYWGRCFHKHGTIIGKITKCRPDIVKFFEGKLNQAKVEH